MANTTIITVNNTDKTFVVSGDVIALNEKTTLNIYEADGFTASNLRFQIWLGGTLVASTISFTDEGDYFEGELSLKTSEMRTVLGNYTKRDSKEFTAVLFDITNDVMVFEGRIDILSNLYDSTGTVTPIPADEYMYKSVYDADGDGIVDVASAVANYGEQETCTDDAITPIPLGNANTYDDWDITFTLNNSTNYIKYRYTIGIISGSPTESLMGKFIRNGSEHSGISITFSVVAGVLYLNINLTAVGSDYECVWRVDNKMLASV